MKMLSYKTKSIRYTFFTIYSYMKSQVECQAHPLLRARNRAQAEGSANTERGTTVKAGRTGAELALGLHARLIG